MARELAREIADWRLESIREDHVTADADALWIGAWTLDSVRLELLTGTMPADDAQIWLDAARDLRGQYREKRG